MAGLGVGGRASHPSGNGTGHQGGSVVTSWPPDTGEALKEGRCSRWHLPGHRAPGQRAGRVTRARAHANVPERGRCLPGLNHAEPRPPRARRSVAF